MARGMLDKAATFRRATRIDGMEISLIVRISEAAAQMRASGQEIVSLSTGAIYSKNELRALAAVLERHPRLWVRIAH